MSQTRADGNSFERKPEGIRKVRRPRSETAERYRGTFVHPSTRVYSVIASFFRVEDRGSMFLRNVGTLIPDRTVL
jgi:hypothetical protein